MRTGLMAAVVGLAGSVGLGASERADTNAALGYYKAWAYMDVDLPLGLISDVDVFALSDNAAVRLQDSQDFIGMVMDAARSGDTDWGVSFEDGPGALMPHLGKMRASARVIGADAIRCMDAGDSRGAANRIAALYRMSDDVTGDRILISSLVAMAISNEGTKLTAHFLDQGALDGGDAKAILSAIGEGDQADRYSIREAIVGEWRIMSEYIVRFTGDDAGKKLMESVMLDASEGPAKALSEMTRSDLLRSLGGFAAYHGDLLDAWDDDDIEEAMQVEKRIENGEYGVLAQVLGASITRMFASHQQSSTELHALIKRLEEIAD